MAGGSGNKLLPSARRKGYQGVVEFEDRIGGECEILKIWKTGANARLYCVLVQESQKGEGQKGEGKAEVGEGGGDKVEQLGCAGIKEVGRNGEFRVC